MKKAIISILTFFGILKKKGTEKVTSTNPPDTQKHEVEFDVLRDGMYLSTEKNLLAVSKAYPELKRSTLYKAFASEENTSRTYEKNNYLVEECRKF